MITRAALLLLPLLALAACTGELLLPARPESSGPAVGVVAPAAGFAGDRVVIEVTNAGDDASALRVLFGASAPVEVEAFDGGRLEVIVPEDATNGLVTVVAPTGRASAATEFAFRGIGAPRSARVSVHRAFKPRVSAAIPVGQQLLAIVSSAYDAAVLTAGERTLPLGLSGVASAAAIDETHALVLTTQGCDAKLFVVNDSRVEDAPVEITQDPVDCEPFVSLVVAGNTAVLAGYQSVAVVDLVSRSVKVLPVPDLEGLVSAIDADHFVLGRVMGVQLLERRQGSWQLTEPAFTFEEEDEFTVAVAAHSSGLVAVLGDTGRISLADAVQWPPRRIATFGIPVVGYRTGTLAFSGDGTRLVATRADAGRVTTFEVGASGLVPLGSTTLEAPGEVFAGRNGLFYVGAEGGVGVVAERTGALVDTIDLSAGLVGPVLREVGEAGARRQVVEVVSTAFERVLQLDPSTLERVPNGMTRLPHGEAIRGLSARSGALLVWRDDGVEQVGSPLRYDVDQPRPGTQDDAHAFVITEARLDILATTPWTGTALVSLDRPGLSWAFPLDGQLATLSSLGARVDDLAKLLAADASSLVSEPPLPEGWKIEDAGARGPHLLATLANEGGLSRQLVRLSIDRHAFEPLGTVPLPPSRSAPLVSPSGRHLWWTTHAGRFHALVGVSIDPRTSALHERPRLELPAGTTGLAISDSGEKLYGLGGNGDELVLIE